MEKKRESIVRAAIDIFIENGYEKASMDRIAERADASKRTVYNHFSTKEDLFHAVIDWFMEERSSHPSITYDPAIPLDEQLDRFIDFELICVIDPIRRGLWRALSSVFLFNTKLAMEALARQGNQHEMLINWLMDAIKDKKITVEDPALAANVFYSVVQGTLIWPSLFQEPFDQTNTEPLKKEIIAMFLARYGAK